MLFKVVSAVALFASLFLTCQGLNRDEIIQEYTPILLEHSANLTAEYNLVVSEAALVEHQLSNDTVGIVTLLQTQVTGLVNTIAAAEKQYVNRTDILACLTIQANATAKVVPTSINSTCWNEDNFNALSTASVNYHVLAGVPNVTLSSCGNLDPLTSQDQLFLNCITEKILDLATQLTILHTNFATAKTATMQTFLKCLADESAAMAQTINEINFAVTMCISM